MLQHVNVKTYSLIACNILLQKIIVLIFKAKLHIIQLKGLLRAPSHFFIPPANMASPATLLTQSENELMKLQPQSN